MEIRGKVAVVTGGASGIGASLVRELVRKGARGVVIGDIQLAPAQALAQEAGALALSCDVTREDDIQALVRVARERFGQVDIYCSNAGILGRPGGLDLEDGVWERMWRMHGMAHLWAARAVVPDMLARGEGGFLITASAAGLLNIVENAPYAVSKHAAVAFGEWLRIAYGRKGLNVSCLCPQGVETDMTRDDPGSTGVDGMIGPQVAAEAGLQALCENRFLALPHAEVADYMQAKTANYDRWLGGMQKLRTRYDAR